MIVWESLSFICIFVNQVFGCNSRFNVHVCKEGTACLLISRVNFICSFKCWNRNSVSHAALVIMSVKVTINDLSDNFPLLSR